MRVLLLCIPGRGRFEVLAPLAGALQQAGHAVRFAAPPRFAQHVRRMGFECLEAGAETDELNALLDAQLAENGTAAMPASERAATMFTRLYPERLLAMLLPQLRDWRPALVLHEEGEFAGPLVAALVGARCATVGWPVAMRPLQVLQNVTQRMDAQWQAQGLQPPPYAGLYQRFIDTCPPTLQTEAAAAFPGAWALRPELVDAPPGSAADALPEALLQPGEPVVHLTLGTVDAYNQAPALLLRLLDGLQREPVRVVLTTGAALQSLDFSRYANVHASAFIPHRQLLPHCDAVICHGGAGSTIAALAHGLPLLIVPRGGASQYRNAVHCERVGAGLHLSEEAATAQAVGPAVAALLHQPGHREAARRLQQEIAAMPAPADCAERLQAWLH
ncbi:MAG TPA: glycosyltransferase [Ideonella sp.]|uniref:glycosyltransferase n=1 Tax=Ideonella sp. TaxID=1929293 RepID=UPI002CF9F329|nr:glycosyltransferase [Ideonella sp.]HSI50388.1 glycosyltransferase [Ideonella sp.]